MKKFIVFALFCVLFLITGCGGSSSKQNDADEPGEQDLDAALMKTSRKVYLTMKRFRKLMILIVLNLFSEGKIWRIQKTYPFLKTP